MEYKIFLMLLFFLFLLLPFFIHAYAHAAETGAQRVAVHYHRPDADYEGWNLWSWNLTANNMTLELVPVKTDEFGLVFELDISKYGESGEIGLLPKFMQWAGKDDPNRVIDRSRLKKGGCDVYMVSGRRETFYEKPDVSPFVKNVFLDSTDEIVVVLSKKVAVKELASLEVKVENLATGKKIDHIKIEPVFFETDDTHAVRVLRVWLADFIAISDHSPFPAIEVSVSGFSRKRATPRNVLYLEKFHYRGELGCLYDKRSCIFRVFAPAADSAGVMLFETPEGPDTKVFEMKRIGNGVWETRIEGDLLNKYYKYRVETAGEKAESIDPYSRCNTAHNGRAMIISDRTPVADAPKFSIDKAVIYEMHIRDFTIDPKTSVKMRGKFLGAAEENTHHVENKSVKTGIAHLLELGVNTVQILPIQDFENDESGDAYNWGYMPVHFNSPDGWYATKPNDASRVSEAKKMVDAFHRNGLKVVMDVVYNHTAEGNELVRHSFNGCAPSYYYRRKPNGEYWNGSGCGNEFKSESPMGRKFIIDSLKYWVREYKIDGFRFDLMGLIDSETVYELVAELRKINPDIFIYGEPWAAGSTPITVTGKGAQKGREFAVFNDIFRDSIKGSVWDAKGGFVQGTTGAEIVSRGMIGSIDDFASAPLESINYCEAHDNRTLYDTLVHTTEHDKTMNEEKIEKMHKLSTLLVLTAQGIPFLHAGQEMMRTKYGEENSYNKPDSVNMISWDRKIEKAEIFEFTKNLIAMRKAHPIFRLKNAAEIRRSVKFLKKDLKLSVPEKCLAMMIKRSEGVDDNWTSALILVNPNRDSVKFHIPKGKWHKFIFDGEIADGSVVETHHKAAASEQHKGEASEHYRGGNTVELKPISSAILYTE